jgi:hypothetical protein
MLEEVGRKCALMRYVSLIETCYTTNYAGVAQLVERQLPKL